VILIMADDLGIEWLGCYGNDEGRTPRLDALAVEGMRFDHCYSTPLCTPSRVAIMTGKYNHRNYDRFGAFPLDDEAKTFGNLMKRAGYVTCMAGKWQLGRAKPAAMGFDRYLQYGVNQARQQNYYWNPTDATIESRIRIDGERATDFGDDYGPDIVARFITDFIDNNRQRPFFVYYPMLLCHAPFQPTPSSTDKQFQGEPKFSNKEKWFADMVQHMDTVVGRIVDHLERCGLCDNTLLIFIGDNGSPHTRTRYRGKMQSGQKGRLTDSGTHVPLIASWPGKIRPGAICADMVDFTDFYATLAELANAKEDPSIDGVSFLPQLRGQTGSPREWAFVYYTPNQVGKPGTESKNAYWARTHRWKLYHDERLYDMEKDGRELRPYLPSQDTAESGAARGRLQAAFNQLKVNRNMLDTTTATEDNQ
jgi:arylsulfatase A